MIVALNAMIERTRLAEALELPAASAELKEAEQKHAEIASDLAAVRTDFETLDMNHSVVELRRVDGSMFPAGSGERDQCLVALYRRRSELEVSKELALRSLNEARRAFEETASQDITPAADAVCEAALVHIDQAIEHLELLQNLNTKASKAGLTIRHPQVARAAGLTRQLCEMQRVLAPTPQMGARN